MGEEKEIDLMELLGVILSKLKFIVLAAVLCAAIGFSYAKFVLPLQYTASIKMYVTSSSDLSKREDASIDVSEQTASRNLASTCIVILDDDSVYEEIGQMLIADYDLDDLKNYFNVTTDDEGNPYISPNQIRGLISVSSVDNTEVLQVTCTTEVPKFSADICKYVSKIAPELLIRTMKAGSVETVSPAKVPKNPSGPNVMRYAMIGGLLGMVVSVAVVIIMNMFDNAVKNGEEIKARFDVPVLAEIPDIFMDTKGGSGKYGRYGK